MVQLPQEALDLVISQEVTNQITYEHLYMRPTWPGGGSGVTIGIGYDLGQVKPIECHMDWEGRVPTSSFDALLECVGVSGPHAHSLAAELRGSIIIPWGAAIGEFNEREVQKWLNRLATSLPNLQMLPVDCVGALFSLVYNRGTSFQLTGPRYAEMRAIFSDMKNQKFFDIPAQIRSMKRLWVGTGLDGLLSRRDAEAALFEKGLAAMQGAKVAMATPHTH